MSEEREDLLERFRTENKRLQTENTELKETLRKIAYNGHGKDVQALLAKNVMGE